MSSTRTLKIMMTVIVACVVLLVMQPHTYGDSRTLNAGVAITVPWCGEVGYEWRGIPGWFACQN